MSRIGDDMESEYDVAISFLHRDLAFAEQIRERLAPGLHAFVYAREQEEVALDDGMERFRTVFKDNAKISLVLHRGGWGHTPWTSIEESAIRDRCLRTSFRSLAIVTLDDSALPEWVPDTHISFNAAEYPLEQLIGAIKRKAEVDFDLRIAPESALDIARRRMQEEEYRQQTTAYFMTPEGAQAVLQSAEEMFALFCEKAKGFRNQTLQWQPECGFDRTMAVARLGYGSVQLLYRAPYSNRVGRLRIRLFNGGLPIPGRNEVPLAEVSDIGNIEFDATRTPSLGICWVSSDGSDPMSAEQVAEFAVGELIALVTRLGP